MRQQSRRLRSDRGQTSLMLVLGVAVLLAIAITLVTTLGRGFTTETRARTAADAAALAAAESYTASVESRLAQLPDNPGLAVGHLLQLLGTDIAQLDTPARREAERLAAANEGQLTALRMSPRGDAIQVTAQARATSASGGNRVPEFAATAEVRLTSGPWCLTGNALGLYRHGRCYGEQDIHLEPPAEDDEETDEGGDEEEPAPPVELPDLPVVVGPDDWPQFLQGLRAPLEWQVSLVE